MSKEYTESELQRFQEIEDYVVQYQQGSLEAAAEILKHFSMLIRAYLFMLKYGQSPKHGKSCERFVKPMFGIGHDVKVVDRVLWIAKIYGEQPRSYIKSDLQCILLDLAKRYTPMGRNFCAYISQVYYYEVARMVQKYMSSPSCWHPGNIEFYDGLIDDTVEDIADTVAEKLDGLVDEFGYLTDTWPNAESDDCIFEGLSSFYKLLLRMYYQDNVPDKRISEMLNRHINTINQRRREAVEILSKRLGLKPIRARQSGKKSVIKTKQERCIA